jgi:hypothetical protein
MAYIPWWQRYEAPTFAERFELGGLARVGFKDGTPKNILKLKEGLPKGVSLVKDGNQYRYKVNISPPQKQPGVKEKAFEKTFVNTDEGRKAAIKLAVEKRQEFFPNRLIGEDFKKLRLKYKNLTASEFAEFLNKNKYTTSIGKKFTTGTVEDMSRALKIGAGVTGPRIFRTVDEAKKIIMEYPDAQFFFASNPSDVQITQYASNLVNADKRTGNLKTKFPTGTTTEAKMWNNFYESALSTDSKKRMTLITDIPKDKNGKVNWQKIEKNGLPAWKNAKFKDGKTGATYTWGKNYKFGNLEKQIDKGYGKGFFNNSVQVYKDQKSLNKQTFNGKSLNEIFREGLLKKELETKLGRKLTNSKADKELLKKFYAQRKPFFSFTEAHHIEGVGKNPFRMDVAYKSANRKAGNLFQKYKAGNLTKEQYVNELENLSESKGGIRYKEGNKFIGKTGTAESIVKAAGKEIDLETKNILQKLKSFGKGALKVAGKTIRPVAYVMGANAVIQAKAQAEEQGIDLKLIDYHAALETGDPMIAIKMWKMRNDPEFAMQEKAKTLAIPLDEGTYEAVDEQFTEQEPAATGVEKYIQITN